MLTVAPSGMVNEETLRSTPIFSSRVSMLSGMVALEVEVENANAMTGKNFFRKRSGLSLVNTNSSSM